MTGRRVLYLLCLAAAVLFYIYDTGYFSWVLLIIGLAFIPLELLVSLPGLLGARARLRVLPRQNIGGQPFTLVVAATAKRPVCTLRAKLLCENLFDQSHHKLKLEVPMGQNSVYKIESYGAACGAVRFTLLRTRVLDAAGLFAFPLKAPGPVLVLARPAMPSPLPVLPDAALDQSSLPDRTASRPGPGAMREFTDIREYRMGDSPRDIHWKLTAKFDKVMVKEGSFSPSASPQLCFDLFGSPEDAARTLGRLQALSYALCDIERLHGIHWYGADGTLNSHSLITKDGFDALLWTLLETPLPAGGTSIAEALPPVPGPVLLVRPDGADLYEDGKLAVQEVGD